MDLKKRHKIILELLAEEAATFETLVEKSGYAEGTVKKAVEELAEANLLDSVNEEDDPTVYFLPIEESEPIAEKKELSNPEEWNVGAKPTEESVEEFDGDEIRLPHLRKMDFLSIQEGDGFKFHNKNWVVESVIEQRPIAGKPFLKMLATTGIENVEFTVNLGREKAPISFKKI